MEAHGDVVFLDLSDLGCPLLAALRELDSWQSKRKLWTRSQRIRTFAEIPFEVTLLVTAEPSKYQQIAEKVLHLNQLGLTTEAIARQLGVDGKTVAKALKWIEV